MLETILDIIGDQIFERALSWRYGRKITLEEVNEILPKLIDVSLRHMLLLNGRVLKSGKKHQDSISIDDVTKLYFSDDEVWLRNNFTYRLKQKDNNVRVRIIQAGYYSVHGENGRFQNNVYYKSNILISGNIREDN